MSKAVFPPKVDAVFDAGKPDEAGNYPREKTTYMRPMEMFSDAEGREGGRRNLMGFSETVDHPLHYTAGPCETIDYIRACLTQEQFIGYCKGNIMKYTSRANRKGAHDEDCKKAARYAAWMEEAIDDWE